MMLCAAGSYLSSLTPSTIVMSSPFAGAEMITFFAPASRCLLAPARSVNLPVDSMTTSTPRSAHGKLAGSRSERKVIFESPAVIVPSSADTSTSSVPSSVSYFSKWANVPMSPRSFAATISMPGAGIACTARQKFLPIRPNPLIPTRTVTRCSHSRRCCAPNSSRHQHVRSQVGFCGRDAKLVGALVGQREQPPDPAGDRVLGQRGLGQLAKFFQAGLAVLDAQLACDDQVLWRLVA